MLCAAMVAAFAAGTAAESGIFWPKTERPTVTQKVRGLLEMEFDEMPFPEGDVQHTVGTSDSAVVDGVAYEIGYNVLLRSGDKANGGTFGLLTDKDGEGIVYEGASLISHGSDFSSLLPKGDGDVYMITHFESPDPGTTYFTKMKQDDKGQLKPYSTEAMDWSEYDGLWVPCAGSVTPWQTHFGSEEYEPNARALSDAAKANPDGQEWLLERFATWVVLYLGISSSSTNAEVAAKFSPYLYGYPWEAGVTEEGEIEFNVKHMAMGRLAIELPYVMPDLKTVYITDDGTNVMLGAFKATTPGEMSCGTLYGAKMTQTSDAKGGEFEVEWIEVGAEACTSDFLSAARSTTFDDLFDTAEPNEDGTCPSGYSSINAQMGHECLALVEGVTTEFSKWEGITYDPVRQRLYTSMSEVRYGMEDSLSKGEENPEHDIGGPNHITVPYNECGCVYAMDVDSSTFLAKNMYGLVCGDKDANLDEFNVCNKENIAQPDNVAYVPHHDGLIIGEDTSAHQNDVIWYYNFEEDSVTRFLSTPYGAETTSPYFYPNINGWSYIMAVVQHPYGESDEDELEHPAATGLSSWVGYVGPFKAHKDSVDMTVNGGVGERQLWNGFPIYGLDAGPGAYGSM